jgi:hypothetical protein
MTSLTVAARPERTDTMTSTVLLDPPGVASTHASVDVIGDRIVVERIEVTDPGLAAFVTEHDHDEWPPLVERALRVGLIALQGAGVTVNLEAIQHAFDGFERRTEKANKDAEEALEAALRREFADGEGRLPLALERYLGQEGELKRFVGDLFDETKGDSAAYRLRELLRQYVDGDDSKLAKMLDPTREGSPLAQFRKETEESFKMLGVQIARLQGHKEERRSSALKGVDFEDAIEPLLVDLVKGSGDDLERTGEKAGLVPNSKKGDFVVTLDRAFARGQEVRIVVEAKDRYVAVEAMRKEIEEARRNRRASVGLVVLSQQHAPAGMGAFDIRGQHDVYCVVDPAAPDPEILKVALRLARLLARRTLDADAPAFDGQRLADHLENVRRRLQDLKKARQQLDIIGRTTKDISQLLDDFRTDVVRELDEAERYLAPADCGEEPA